MGGYINISVFKNESVEYDIPEVPEEFFKYFQAKLDLIPEEFKASAKIEIETVESYGSSQLELNIYYTRLRTDEEVKKEAAYRNGIIERTEKKERLELERLSKKYNIKG